MAHILSHLLQCLWHCVVLKPHLKCGFSTLASAQWCPASGKSEAVKLRGKAVVGDEVLGFDDGKVEGCCVGLSVGTRDGTELGSKVGGELDAAVGASVGTRVGFLLGMRLGDDVGLFVG